MRKQGRPALGLPFAEAGRAPRGECCSRAPQTRHTLSRDNGNTATQDLVVLPPAGMGLPGRMAGMRRARFSES
jgi:hypothetical protein